MTYTKLGGEGLALTTKDFKQLRETRDPSARAAVARKISVHIENASYSSDEYRLACEIATMLQQDKHVQVRLALSEGLQHSHNAPKEVVIMLAHDEEEAVAVPILKHSDLLSEGDLLEIVEATQQILRLIAIAERKPLSDSLVEALIEKLVE